MQLVIVTGMSGAGRSTVLRALEDRGFEAVDNLPLTLFRALLREGAGQEALSGSLAVGVDSRSRGLDPPAFVEELERWRRRQGVSLKLLFMECEDEVLRRRYTESRRRHPMAQDRPVTDGIARERTFMAPLKAAADLVCDTTLTSTTDLRRWVAARFSSGEPQPLTISLISFAFRSGVPREADLVFDMRFLRNPHYVDELRPKTGQDEDVQAYVAADPDFRPTLDRLQALLLPLLPRYASEGKSYLTIAMGCTGGQHRSVFMAEALGLGLRRHGWRTTIIHRDIAMKSATMTNQV
jgi:UPF0042 nucleotide-binding protein